jgi:hypothetical protein
MAKTRNPGLLLKNFSGHIFGAFAMDLVRLNDTGLAEAQCKENRMWLEEIASLTATLPDSALPGKKIFERCDDIVKEYVKWNAPNGTPDSRRKYHQRIKRKINKLSGTYRCRTVLLEKEADINFYRSLYTATEQLIHAIPDLVTTITQVFLKFPKGVNPK